MGWGEPRRSLPFPEGLINERVFYYQVIVPPFFLIEVVHLHPLNFKDGSN